MSVAKRVSEDRARFGSHRARGGGSFALALDDLAAPVGRRRRPSDKTRQIPARNGATAFPPSRYRYRPNGVFCRIAEKMTNMKIVMTANPGAPKTRKVATALKSEFSPNMPLPPLKATTVPRKNI